MDRYTNNAKLPQVFAAAQPVNVQASQKSAIQSSPPLITAVACKPSAARKPTHDEIAKRAYQIYIEKGMPRGQSEQIWQQAEKELLSRG